MKILFNGRGALRFREGFETLLETRHDIFDADDGVDPGGFAGEADVIVGGHVPPGARSVRLFHVAGAGYDGVDVAALPPGAMVCNCFGHEQGIAEYIIGALMRRNLRLGEADAELRRGEWRFGGGAPEVLRDELGASSIGILGYGHIGRAVTHLARAFGMTVTACSRRPVEEADRWFTPAELKTFMGSADAIVVAVPLNDATRGMVDAAALAAMRPDAVIVNVARGPVIDEQALFDALSNRAIGGAVIDTWYTYPSAPGEQAAPATLPFSDLDNVVMTPHMSGWTQQLIARRQQTMAENIERLVRGEPLHNVVHVVV